MDYYFFIIQRNNHANKCGHSLSLPLSFNIDSFRKGFSLRYPQHGSITYSRRARRFAEVPFPEKIVPRRKEGWYCIEIVADLPEHEVPARFVAESFSEQDVELCAVHRKSAGLERVEKEFQFPSIGHPFQKHQDVFSVEEPEVGPQVICPPDGGSVAEHDKVVPRVVGKARGRGVGGRGEGVLPLERHKPRPHLGCFEEKNEVPVETGIPPGRQWQREEDRENCDVSHCENTHPLDSPGNPLRSRDGEQRQEEIRIKRNGPVHPDGLPRGQNCEHCDWHEEQHGEREKGASHHPFRHPLSFPVEEEEDRGGDQVKLRDHVKSNTLEVEPHPGVSVIQVEQDVRPGVGVVPKHVLSYERGSGKDQEQDPRQTPSVLTGRKEVQGV